MNKTSNWFISVYRISQCMDDVYNNIDDYNPSGKSKILLKKEKFDDMIVDIMTNKNSKP